MHGSEKKTAGIFIVFYFEKIEVEWMTPQRSNPSQALVIFSQMLILFPDFKIYIYLR